MNRLLSIALLSILFACNPDNRLIGDWTIIYAGQGNDVRDGSIGIPFSNTHETNLSFHSADSLRFFDEDNKVLRKCYYRIEGSRMLLTGCEPLERAGNSERQRIYVYELSNDTLRLFDEDYKWVMHLRRTKKMN